MRFILFTLLLAILWSCKQDNIPLTAKAGQPHFSAVQAAGCYHGPLADKTSSETCFDYSFKDTLKVIFCLPANCCPDSNRFDFTLGLSNDTINLAIQDTAADLCDCICTYRIFANVSGLNKEHYLFNCFYRDSLYYSEKLRR